MLDRVLANPDRIIIVLITLALLIVIATWITTEIDNKKNLKVVNN